MRTSTAETTAIGCPDNEWRAGWRVLAAASVGTGLSLGLFVMTAGLFIVPMQEEFGWSRSALSIGPAVMLFGALLQPFAGLLIDRVGARPMALLGLILLASAYPLLALTGPNPWAFYSIVALMAVAAPLTNGVALIKGVVTWFTRNSGLAIGITLCGPSITTALCLPLLAYVIGNFGWRAGYMTIFFLLVLVALPVVSVWYRERPRTPANTPARAEASAPEHSQSIAPDIPGATLTEATRDRKFWLMILALGGAALPIGGFLSQTQPLLNNQGFTLSAAASIGTVFALAIGLGRIAAGALVDRFNPSVVAATCLALPVLGTSLLLVTVDSGISWLVAATAVVLLGLGQGAEADFIAFFTRRLFGLRRFSLILGTVGMVVSGGIAAGGLMFAAIFDAYGSYHLALYISIAIYLSASLVMLTIKVSCHTP